MMLAMLTEWLTDYCIERIINNQILQFSEKLNFGNTPYHVITRIVYLPVCVRARARVNNLASMRLS